MRLFSFFYISKLNSVIKELAREPAVIRLNAFKTWVSTSIVMESYVKQVNSHFQIGV